MNRKIQKFVAIFSLVLLLASMIVLPTPAEAASEFYGDYTDVAVIADYNSCPSIQGIAVGSQMIYTVKINGDDTSAFITMTDKDTGTTTRLYNKDAGSYMFNYLDHANDMDVWGIDGYSHIFVATTKQGANGIVRLKRDGSNLTKVATYRLQCDGEDICATAMSIMSVSGGKINFLTKWGMDLYTGSVSTSATNATINMTKLCTISKDKVYIKGEYLDLSTFVNQGMGYHNGVLYVPISGDDNWLNRSVIMVFNLDGVIPGSIIRPSDSLVFRVTSGAYSALFELESCDISSGDGKLYFGVQRRKSSTDTNHDGIASFDGYTFSKLTEPADYKNFVIQYNANGGSGSMANTTVPYGVSTALSKNTFTKDGGKFAGWTAYRSSQNQWYYTNGSSTGWYTEGSQPSGYTKYIYSDGAKVAKTSSLDGEVVKLYAQWEASTYTVRYNANGGTGTMADTTVTYGVSTKLRANAFTRSGYSFVGWHAYRTAKNQWYYTNGTSSAWYTEGSQPSGYYKDTYSDQVSVAKTTGTDGDVVVMYAQWASNGNADPYDYYLFGWINGADYACEGDHANLGIYKFNDGKLTATFDYDSYIGVKKVDAASGAVVTWYMTSGWQGYVTSAYLYDTNYLGNADKMYVPGGVPVTFSLVDYNDGSISISYTTGSVACSHSYNTTVTTAPTCTTTGVLTYSCTKCGNWYSEIAPATGHNFVNGYCNGCGVFDGSAGQSDTYYLVGWINDADYGCEADWENMGSYKFVNGQLTAKFTSDSYVFVKTEGNARWLLAEAYIETAYGIFKEGGTEKMFVPGGVELVFTLVENADGSVTLSYTQGSTSACDHSYTAEVTTAATCTTTGIRKYTCTKCGYSYTQSVAATGHNFFGNQCTLCGMADPNPGTTTGTTYYLVGYINGADYGCEWDWQNLGQYKFVNGKLTATFTQDSYVFVKTGDNQDWLMATAYCEASTCTFVEGGSEKMFVPGGVQVTFALKENTDGSVTLTYTTGSATASVLPTLTLKAPTLEFKDMITVNAFFTAENTQDVVEMGMITYTSQVERWSVRTAEYIIPGATYVQSSGRYYSSSQGIHGKYLADTVYLAIYAKLTDGSYVYSKLAPYSPLTYADSQLRNSTDTKMKQLVVAMLQYGTQAQLYFGHNTGNLANANLTADQLTLPESYRSNMVTAVASPSATKQGSFANNQGFSKKYPSISFEGAFCINYFFTPNYVPDSGITLYYWNAEDYNGNSVLTSSNATGKFKLEGTGTGEYRGDITGIAAKALSEAVYVACAYKSNGTVWTSGVLGYSIGSYCSSQASKGSDIAALAMATAVYGYHAKQYFG